MAVVERLVGLGLEPLLEYGLDTAMSPVEGEWEKYIVAPIWSPERFEAVPGHSGKYNNNGTL